MPPATHGRAAEDLIVDLVDGVERAAVGKAFDDSAAFAAKVGVDLGQYKAIGTSYECIDPRVGEAFPVWFLHEPTRRTRSWWS